MTSNSPIDPEYNKIENEDLTTVTPLPIDFFPRATIIKVKLIYGLSFESLSLMVCIYVTSGVQAVL